VKKVVKNQKNRKKSKNQKNLQNPDSEILLCSTRLGRPGQKEQKFSRFPKNLKISEF
jgi:hypothetical protein